MNIDVYSDKYETSSLLQNGNFGNISLSKRKSDGRETVTKVVSVHDIFGEWVPSKRNCDTLVPLEVFLLETLTHPNIIQMVDYFETSTHFIIVTERRRAGIDLFDFINRQPQMDETLVSHIFQQVVSAVNFMHSLNILHGDIKEENVVIDADFNCVLIDFGSAAYFGPRIAFSSYSGSPQCASPEVLRGEIYHGPEHEIWSLGILLYTLFHYDYPFHTQHDILNANLTIAESVSLDMQDIIRKCLHPLPTKRFTIIELAKQPALQQPIDLNNYNFFEMLSEDTTILEESLSKNAHETDMAPDNHNNSVEDDDHDSHDSTSEDPNSSDGFSDAESLNNSFVESFLSKILI